MNRNHLERAVLLGAALLMSAGLAACQGPCRTLAERICECEPSATMEQACLLQIDAVNDANVSVQEEEVCDVLLDSCDCNALERQDLAACGLSKP